MPTLIMIIGGLFGAIFGVLLGTGMAAVAGLPLYGPVTNVFAALIGTGILPGIIPVVVHPIGMLFGAGLGLLALTIFVYAAAAIATIGASALAEMFARGTLIGLSAGANLVILAAIPLLPPGLGPILFLILMLACIPVVAANRFYQRVIGALGWVLPMNYLMLPLGVLLFLIAAPFALAAGGPAAIRWDWLTWTVETNGGFILATFGPPGGAFNIGNFTFITTTPAMFTFTSGLSAHETGHTLNGSAFGGFFYWIGAVDENVPPLARGRAANSEMLADDHFGGLGGPSITMWT
jgi:hypothetical protein